MEKKSKFRRVLTWVGSIRLIQVWKAFTKLFSLCWKTGLATIAIVAVVAITDLLIDMYDDDRCDWHDENLGKNVEIRRFSTGQVATYNKTTGQRLSPKLRWISCVPERDSLTVFCDQDGKRGFLNVNTGQIVIDGQYRKAWHFSDGLAAVLTQNDRIGFINYDNELVIPDIYHHVEGFDYVFYDGVCVVKDCVTRLCGAIDTLGNQKLPVEYSRIFKAGKESTWYLRKDGKCGLADADMNIIFEPVYDNIRSYPEKNNATLTRNGVKQLVDFDGNVIQPFVIDEAYPLEYQEDCKDDDMNTRSLHPYLVEIIVDYCCHGVMDSRTGKMVIPAIYSDIKMISKDIIMAEIGCNEENNLLFTSQGVIIK